MMNGPSVSVLMPAYNVEKYIGEAIDSILNQTFRDFEFIIVDDASTDNTLAVIEKYNDPRVKIIRNEKNLKLAASLNRGLGIVRGKYIARMDADDLADPQRFQKLFDFLEKNPAIDICGSAMKIFGSAGDSVWEYKLADKEIRAGLVWNSSMPHAAVLMRADTIRKHKLYYDETFLIGQDWKYWFAAKEHVRFANLKEALYFYRRDQQSVTIQYSHQSGDRYAVMHRLFLRDMGITFTERELLLHQFIIGIFSISPSPGVIREARAWKEKLISHNHWNRKYDPVSFQMIALEKWSGLFFKIVPFGFRCVLSYFRVTGMRPVHLAYYAKYLLTVKR